MEPIDTIHIEEVEELCTPHKEEVNELALWLALTAEGF